jgi:AcrR family transcriptional regulator
MTTASRSTDSHDGRDAPDVRARILDAAFALFMEQGYAATSTIEIATRARVSKRDLYTVVGNKQELLAACVSARARRLRLPADLPVPQDRKSLAGALVSFGTQVVREVTDPSVVAVFRLAIAEAVGAPEVARALESLGRETTRAALLQIMTRAKSSGLLDGRPNELAEQFGALLWGDLMIELLLGVAKRPSLRVTTARALRATSAFLQLNPEPGRNAMRTAPEVNAK